MGSSWEIFGLELLLGGFLQIYLWHRNCNLGDVGLLHESFGSEGGNRSLEFVEPFLLHFRPVGLYLLFLKNFYFFVEITDKIKVEPKTWAPACLSTNPAHFSSEFP